MLKKLKRDKIIRNKIEGEKLEKIRHEQEKLEKNRYRKVQIEGKNRTFKVDVFIQTRNTRNISYYDKETHLKFQHIL